MPNQFDELIPNAKTARRVGTTTRTVFRWSADPKLDFPKPYLINGRRYFSAAEIDAWLANRKPGAVAQTALDPSVGSGLAIVAPTAKPKPSPINRRHASEITEV